MCGRYTLASDPEELVEAFDLPGLTFDYFARYNVAPSQPAPVVAEDAKGRRIGLMNWGLVPRWKDEPGSGFINARAETVAEKASFREAFRRRRCLVPADGFYEWKRGPEGKIPHWFHPPVGGLLSFAGIWERWARPGVEASYGFAILTTDANGDVRDVHDRMPVVIGPADRATWLSGDRSPQEVGALLEPAPEGTFARRVVSTRVNRPADDDPGLIEPL